MARARKPARAWWLALPAPDAGKFITSRGFLRFRVPARNAAARDRSCANPVLIAKARDASSAAAPSILEFLPAWIPTRACEFPEKASPAEIAALLAIYT